MLRPPDRNIYSFYGLSWSPNGQRLASGTYQRGVQIFDLAAQCQLWLEPESTTWILHLAWSPDGARFAGGGDDGIVYVWDTVEGTLLQRLVRHHTMVMAIAWNPTGTQLATVGGSAGDELFIWDAQRGEYLGSFSEHTGTISAVVWVSNEVLISGGGDGALRWWDVPNGKCVRVRQAHQGTVQSLRRSPDKARLASCGDDGCVMLWDMHSGQHLRTLRRERLYERLDISGVSGLTEAQLATMRALGAVEAQPAPRALAPAVITPRDPARQ